MPRFFILFICSFFAPYAFSQVNLNYQHLDNRSGLSNSCVNDLFLDSDNLLWAGTFDGLNLYTGENFLTFNYNDPALKGGISGNVVFGIEEDAQKDIWVNTNQGISRYNKRSGEFRNYVNVAGQSLSGVKWLLMSHDKQIYVAKSIDENTTQLYSYDKKIDSFSLLQTIEGIKVRKGLFDKTGHLLLLTTTGELLIFTKAAAAFRLKKRIGARNLFELNNRLYVSINGSDLHLLDVNTGFCTKQAGFSKNIYQVGFFHGRNYLVWEDRSISSCDSAFVESPYDDKELEILKDKQITCLLKRDTNTLWVGTDGSGIFKLNKETVNFPVFKAAHNGFNKPVRSFCFVDSFLWVGTKGDGIISIPYEAGILNTAHQTMTKHILEGGIDRNSVYVMQKSEDGSRIYIGSDGPGISIYDVGLKKFIPWEDIKKSQVNSRFASIYAIIEDEDGSIWCGTSGYGLVHTKLVKTNGQYSIEYVERFNPESVSGPAGSNIIFSILKYDKYNLLLGCRNTGGVSLFNKKTRSFKNIRTNNYEGALSHNDILSLYRDREDRIWIGTSYGLNSIKSADLKNDKPVFSKLNTTSGLPNNTVHAIIQDNAGDIWISTNNGLAKIDPNNKQVLHFKEKDGLQSNEFSDGAILKDRNGNLFFGGIYGFNFFQPEKIRLNGSLSNLLLSGLKIGGKEVNPFATSVFQPGAAGAGYEHYDVSRNVNFFELLLKPITYSYNDKTIIRYFLEGHDKSWNSTYPGEKIQYFNISPGQYVLKAKWSGGNGQWSDEIVIMELKVRQYLWLTIPAFLVYAVIAAAMLLILYRHLRNKRRLKQQLVIQDLMRKKDEELHAEKINFFTNIAHELQTPLTLIVGATEQCNNKSDLGQEREEKNFFLSLIHQQSARLTYLVQQLMDFRKAESGHLRNQYSYFNLSELLLNIAGLFLPIQQSKKIDFKRHIQPGIVCWIDRDKLEKIIFNLLSNAFKHCAEGSEIVIRAQRAEDNNSLTISVFNTGTSLSPANLDKIFKQFFVTDTSQQKKFSTGIGLAFTSQLVKVMNGTINTSLQDGGVNFILQFPMNVVPGDTEILPSYCETPEDPSALIQSATMSPSTHAFELSISEKNKQALVSGLDKQKPTLLVIEDDAPIRYLLRDIFHHEYILYEAECGDQALELLTRMIPDIIISDIMLPGMDGLELCARIKNTPNTCHIPVVLLTARGMMEHQTEGYEAGSDAYITKPFHVSHLLVRVRKLVEYRRFVTGLFKKEGLPSHLDKEEMEAGDREFLDRLISTVEDNIDNTELNISMLEKKLFMTRMQLYRKLKSATDMTPAEFIRSVRLKKVASLLQHSNLSVSDIFYKTGFNNQSYFYREFKKQFGCSPNEYRGRQNISAK